MSTPAGASWTPPTEHSSSDPLSSIVISASQCSEIEGGQRGRYIERQLVGFGQNSVIVSSNLVEDNIFGYPVSAYDCFIDPSLSHEASRGALADQCHVYSLMDQFPGGQPRPLVQGP